MSAEDRKTHIARELLTHHSVLGARVDGVTALLARGEQVRLGDGHLLCEEGKSGESLYFLTEGRVRVSRDGLGEYMQVLAVLEAPSILGHVSLIDGSPRSATCTVLGEATVVRLYKKVYDQLLSETTVAGTSLRRMLLSSLTQQLTAGNTKIRSILAGELKKPRKKPAPQTETPRTESRRASGIHTATRPRASRDPIHSLADEDGSAQELLRIAGVMEDWQVDMRGVDNMELVVDEDMRRRQHKQRRY